MQAATGVLCMDVAGQVFGVALPVVSRVVWMAKLTEVPGSRASLAGVLNLGGTGVPVLDLRSLFGLGERNWHRHTPLVLLEFQGRQCGLIADELGEVEHLALEEALPTSTPFLACCHAGPPPVMVLDHERLFQVAL